jgi:alkylation response protein AidB-like acyl-CoA dehydrogenase
MTESVAEFAQRARAWLAANMPRIADPANPPYADRGEADSWRHVRKLQRRLYDGGFAGTCFPTDYGGLGLDIAYQKAFDDESAGYEMPLILNTPTFTICCATILDTGSEGQKRQHISAALRGDEVLVQLLSEPSGGSDLAGVITRAERRGEKWIVNGAKTWSTGAFAADYGLLLARTNWDVPKHEGLTMFLARLDSPGITLRRIKQVNGSTEFCEEFFDDLELGDDAAVGEVDKGWEVASRQLYHERRAVGGGSEFASGTAAPDRKRLGLPLQTRKHFDDNGIGRHIDLIAGRQVFDSDRSSGDVAIAGHQRDAGAGPVSRAHRPLEAAIAVGKIDAYTGRA